MKTFEELKEKFKEDYLGTDPYHSWDAHDRLNELLDAYKNELLSEKLKCPNCGATCSVDGNDGSIGCDTCDYDSYSD